MAIRRLGVAPGIRQHDSDPDADRDRPGGETEFAVVERLDGGAGPPAMAIGLGLSQSRQAGDEFLAAMRRTRGLNRSPGMGRGGLRVR